MGVKMGKIETFLSKNRKLKLTLLYFFVVTVMLIISKIDAVQYIDFLKWSLGLFAGANAVQKIGRKHCKTFEPLIGEEDDGLR